MLIKPCLTALNKEFEAQPVFGSQRKRSAMRKGFTLLEILTTLIIIITLAAILLPRLSTTTQKVEQRKAEQSLRAIRMAQKMFFARNGLYACATACANAAAINTAFGGVGIAITDGVYVYSMTSADATHFIATADTTGTANDLTLDEAGTFKKEGVVYTPP
jgi:prepilin-type N-terminal cleavage/methylation domain-containing protein